MTGALENLRVLDLSRVLAGPWATQLLGDYGADVVKVERPGEGDETRRWGPPWLDPGSQDVSGYFLGANRNKRSITIALDKPQGQQLLRDLAAKADVLIENFRVGTMAGWGLGADTLLEENPRLVYCSISAFGQHSSRADEPGYDAMIQASAGLMSITGPPPDNPAGPQKVGVAVADIMAGMYAATAMLAALHARQETGRGQRIDVPLYDSQVAWLANQNMNFLLSGKVPGRLGTAHPNLVPYQAFATSDGNIVIAVGNDTQFARCCRVLGLPEMATDPRFATAAARVEHRDELVGQMADVLCTATTADWLQRFVAAKVPAGPVNDIGEVLGNEFARERLLVRSIDNSVGHAVPFVANPVDFSATAVSYERAPPLLGEHTDEVLREWLRYPVARINSLRDDAII